MIPMSVLKILAEKEPEKFALSDTTFTLASGDIEKHWTMAHDDLGTFTQDDIDLLLSQIEEGWVYETTWWLGKWKGIFWKPAKYRALSMLEGFDTKLSAAEACLSAVVEQEYKPDSLKGKR